MEITQSQVGRGKIIMPCVSSGGGRMPMMIMRLKEDGASKCEGPNIYFDDVTADIEYFRHEGYSARGMWWDARAEFIETIQEHPYEQHETFIGYLRSLDTEPLS